MKTELGKIRSFKLGQGGYQDAMYGFSISLGGDAWGVQDFWGNWSHYPEGAKYSYEEWRKGHMDAYFKAQDLMTDAKVTSLEGLIGKPVMATFDDSRALKSFRILTEVL